MQDTVLDNIVAANRMPILFIGSGLSRRYLYKYPNWDELLELSFKKISEDPFQYQKHIDQFKRQGLTPFEINTKLATIIEDQFNEAFFDRRIKIGRSKNPGWVRKGISPYKMFLCYYFKHMTLNNSPALTEEIEKLRALRNKVSAILTTNYDLFLEKEIFNSDFKVFVRQNELFSSDSYNIAEIYKIHGSVSDANSIVITEADYESFTNTRKLIIAKMLTLFAESPIIFLGYSFTDENIQTIIADFLGCLTSVELAKINQHFIFISYKKGEQSLIQVNRTIMTPKGVEIPITEIQTDNYSLVYEKLNCITPGISPVRIRETKRIVKTIVDQNSTSANADSVIVGIDDLSNIDLTSKPLAIAIGYKENILNKFGYGLLADDMIFEDILYDNKRFDADQMCSERLKSIASTRLLPVHKYIKAASTPLGEHTKLYGYAKAHSSKDSLLPGNIKKQLKNTPVCSSAEEIRQLFETMSDVNKKAGIILKNINTLSVSEIRDFCKELFKENRTDCMSSTHFKRCVMFIDLNENL